MRTVILGALAAGVIALPGPTMAEAVARESQPQPVRETRNAVAVLTRAAPTQGPELPSCTMTLRYRFSGTRGPDGVVPNGTWDHAGTVHCGLAVVHLSVQGEQLSGGAGAFTFGGFGTPQPATCGPSPVPSCVDVAQTGLLACAVCNGPFSLSARFVIDNFPPYNRIDNPFNFECEMAPGEIEPPIPTKLRCRGTLRGFLT